MFFVGQSGYIITLLLTAFLPVFLLMANPGTGVQHFEPTDSGQISHLTTVHISLGSYSKEQCSDQDSVSVFQDELPPLFSRSLRKEHIPNWNVFSGPSLILKTNKSPPVV